MVSLTLLMNFLRRLLSCTTAVLLVAASLLLKNAASPTTLCLVQLLQLTKLKAHTKKRSNQQHLGYFCRERNESCANVANDFYHRYPSDLNRLKKDGLETFRFSIAWSRVMTWNNTTHRMVVNPEDITFTTT
ncbi:Beta-glucosidase 28 [Phytophthora citrophthora]|uniref:Beta-glucosidase 28 n=1 Tax=Phytophthora citrophthora TaxID=4793 RepID=A0AAD9GAU5_9STRA|nr:Beta-glucosidase 28 [Phytophthora citrophthora]